jgi:predicted RNA binding protein YcfA (HicA-like mRNA interferase family)
MSQHRKLLERLRSKPTDFIWSELETALEGIGYRQERGGGSRRKFVHSESGAIISLHQPHPQKELKAYQIRDIVLHLKSEGHL